jgi:RNA polymerase sigma-70 factor (ECF subfamily)
MIAMAALLTRAASGEQISLQSAPPVVVRTAPVAGSTDVDPSLTEIRVTFSKPMQDGSWSWSTWGEENYPEGTGEPRYLPDGRTCVLPVKLQPDKFYAIWLNSDKFHNFKDDTGRPAVPYLLTFVTGKTAGGFGGGGKGGFGGGGSGAGKTTDRLTQISKPEGTGEGGGGTGSTRSGMGGPGGGAGGTSSGMGGGPGGGGPDALLNAQQNLVLAWTDRQFGSYFDARKFDGWSVQERAELETKTLETLEGPHNREYYQAIGILAALRSQKAVQPLLAIAADHAEKDCRDRWMAIRALGLIGDKQVVPELIPLVYHGNLNTHQWAQISLVRLTGQNFGSDWEAWGKWWNGQNGQPPFTSKIIRWWSEQPEPEKLAETLADNDRKFLQNITPTPAAEQNSAESEASSSGKQ